MSPCYVMLCYAMLCHVALCCAVLSLAARIMEIQVEFHHPPILILILIYLFDRPPRRPSRDKETEPTGTRTRERANYTLSPLIRSLVVLPPASPPARPQHYRSEYRIVSAAEATFARLRPSPVELQVRQVPVELSIDYANDASLCYKRGRTASYRTKTDGT